MSMLWVVGSLAALVLAYALHRLALRLEARGYLYYLNRRPKVSMIASLASTFDPALRQILEAQEQENLDENESGDPPSPPAVDHPTLRYPNRRS